MIGINSGGSVGVSGVFVTNLDEIGSLDNSCIHNPNNNHPINKHKKKRTNKEKKKNNLQAYYRIPRHR